MAVGRFPEDDEREILSGVVFMVRTAMNSGGNEDFLIGALAAFQYSALSRGVSWPKMLGEAMRELRGCSSQIELLLSKEKALTNPSLL